VEGTGGYQEREEEEGEEEGAHDGEWQAGIEPRGKVRVPGLCGAGYEIRFPTVKLRKWPFGLRDDWAGGGYSTWLGRAAVTGLVNNKLI
jgi:hypothetical protein